MFSIQPLEKKKTVKKNNEQFKMHNTHLVSEAFEGEGGDKVPLFLPPPNFINAGQLT